MKFIRILWAIVFSPVIIIWLLIMISLRLTKDQKKYQAILMMRFWSLGKD